MKHTTLKILLAAIAAAFLWSCGPVRSTIVILDAEKEFDRAEANRAMDKKETEYSYWSAKEYLYEAKIQEGHSRFRAAQKLGKRANEFATEAAGGSKAPDGDPWEAPPPPAFGKKAKPAEDDADAGAAGVKDEADKEDKKPEKKKEEKKPEKKGKKKR